MKLLARAMALGLVVSIPFVANAAPASPACAYVVTQYGQMQTSIEAMYAKLIAEEKAALKAAQDRASGASPAELNAILQEIKEREAAIAALQKQQVTAIAELQKQSQLALAACEKAGTQSTQNNLSLLCGKNTSAAVVVVVEPSDKGEKAITAFEQLVGQKPRVKSTSLIGTDGRASVLAQASRTAVVLENGSALLSTEGTRSQRAARAVAAFMLKRQPGLVVVRVEAALTTAQKKMAALYGYRIAASSETGVRQAACPK